MTDATQLHVPTNPVRFVTAASLFDGHDASINIMRRILQSQGAEVIHLGHDRSVDEVVTAAIQEDVQGVAISSYQGGHVEYFSYLVELLAERGADHVKVFGGGGGVIVAEEIEPLRSRGVRIFSPADGQRLGLAGMINEMIRACDVDLAAEISPRSREGLLSGDTHTLARTITALEAGRLPEAIAAPRSAMPPPHRAVPVLGITGTGGSGQVLAHRRTGAPPAPGPAGQAADRGARRRPDATQGRRRAARRPHPDERPGRPAPATAASTSARWPPAARAPRCRRACTT